MFNRARRYERSNLPMTTSHENARPQRSHHSRAAVNPAPGFPFVPGTVLSATGNLAKMSVGVTEALPTNVGNGVLTLASPPLLDSAIDGVYQVVMRGDGAWASFDVVDPNGLIIGRGDVGAAFAGPVAFMIAGVSTPFAKGDAFSIPVDRPDIEGEIFWPLDPAATDGRQNARAIAVGGVAPASAAGKPIDAIISHEGVDFTQLRWPQGASAAQIAEWIKQLAEFNIIVRVGV
jgi:hypothetical protein